MSNPEIARYRALLRTIKESGPGAFLKRGRAALEVHRDRLYFAGGAMNFQDWLRHHFAGKHQFTNILDEMKAASLVDECLENGLTPPSTRLICVALCRNTDRLEICRAANDAARAQNREPVQDDFSLALRDYLEGHGVAISQVSASITTGRTINAFAERINSIRKDIIHRLHQPGWELLRENWGPIAVHLRKAWGMITATAPWVVCPGCLNSGADCRFCKRRGFITKRLAQVVFSHDSFSDQQRTLSKMMTAACKKSSEPIDYSEARRRGLMVCCRCGRPTKKRAKLCDRCHEQSATMFTKEQVLSRLRSATETVAADPGSAIEVLAEFESWVENYTFGVDSELKQSDN